MITEKKLYSTPSMSVVPLIRQKALLEDSDKEKTPWLPPGFIGEASLDKSHNG